MNLTPEPQNVSPERILDALMAYRRTGAMKAAIELDLFSVVGNGATAAEVAAKLGTPERGVRMLCDFLAMNGFLTKAERRYDLAPDAALFLDRRSPAYLGGVSEFVAAPSQVHAMGELAAAVRHGGAPQPTPVADYPEWITFARAMGPFMAMQAEMLAERFGPVPGRILDVAASHGLFGIAFAKRSPTAEVTALDAKPVLEVVARDNAAKAGVAARYHLLSGDAFQVALGDGYDLVLLTNFLHHFAPPTIVPFLRRVRAALKPGGRVLTLEFVPNPDRISPPQAAGFGLTMLANTAAGDAYTFIELEKMFREAGFSSLEEHPLPTPQTALLASL